MGFPKLWYHFGGPCNKEPGILAFIFWVIHGPIYVEQGLGVSYFMIILGGRRRDHLFYSKWVQGCLGCRS